MRIINHIWIEGKKMNILNRKRTLKDSIEHQGIGGKEIVIEGEVPFDDIVFNAVFCGNWACKNYLDRREEINKPAVYVPRHYYGKVGALGYLVGSDEFKEGDFDKEYFDFVEELHANSRDN